MIQRGSVAQEVPWATINALAPFFTPGLRCIDETVLTGTAASVTFSNIPGYYRTLMLFHQVRTDRAATTDTIYGRFNADAGANYHRVYGSFLGNNTRTSGSNFNQTSFYAGGGYGNTALANTFRVNEIQIQNYALTDRYKHVVAQTMGIWAAAGASTIISWYGGLWLNTNAITSIALFPSVGPNFIAGCRFTLYGIL